jgi:hypothetical protein
VGAVTRPQRRRSRPAGAGASTRLTPSPLSPPFLPARLRSLKSDFGGHDNFHVANLDLFFAKGFGIDDALEGHADAYADNWLYLATTAASTNYGDGQRCSPGGGLGVTDVRNNTVWTPSGTAITECGMSLSAWQAQGGDPGTTASAYPDDAVVLGIARQLLGL